MIIRKFKGLLLEKNMSVKYLLGESMSVDIQTTQTWPEQELGPHMVHLYAMEEGDGNL
jgi:hypothetical protein